MTHAVIDTNILVSALLSGKTNSAAAVILDKMLAGDITVVYCDGILSEYREVLYREKFHFPRAAVDTLLAFVADYGHRVAPLTSGVVLPDADDQPFYDAAFSSRDRNAWLVTCNIKHFPREAHIVTPWDFLSAIRQGG